MAIAILYHVLLATIAVIYAVWIMSEVSSEQEISKA